MSNFVFIFWQTNHRFRLDIALLCLDIRLAGTRALTSEKMAKHEGSSQDKNEREQDENEKSKMATKHQDWLMNNEHADFAVSTEKYISIFETSTRLLFLQVF